MTNRKMALITGASKGLGLALAKSLAKSGWNLIITARNPSQLHEAKNELKEHTEVIAISGDVRDEIHLLELAQILDDHKQPLDLVVNNASALGTSPLPNLLDQPVEDLHIIFHTNVIAPISLLQKVKPYLKANAMIINISSDAGKEAYENWGAYGGSKAGLDHMTAVLEKENPDYHFYSFDPGDMNTEMHQRAFPGEDIADRPKPEESAVPAILQIIDNKFPVGRYTISSLNKIMI